MKKETIEQLNTQFEASAYIESNIEYWLARDLQKLLGYSKWENFAKVIGKAKISCKHSGQAIEDHFIEMLREVQIGANKNKRSIQDFALTRYACYLIAQNGDPRKEPIAFAQSYFAIQTRKQELLEQRIELIERLTARKKLTETEIELSKNIYERGVDSRGFGRIRSKGDSALFGGHNTAMMKKKLNVPEKRPLADFLPTLTIKAKDFAAEITNHNVRKNNLQGEKSITDEHVKNNQDVRSVLVNRGIKPEDLPPAEDIKKLQRKEKSLGKHILKQLGLGKKKKDDQKQ